jgi:hypothetical protein
LSLGEKLSRRSEVETFEKLDRTFVRRRLRNGSCRLPGPDGGRGQDEVRHQTLHFQKTPHLRGRLFAALVQGTVVVGDVRVFPTGLGVPKEHQGFHFRVLTYVTILGTT